MEWKRETLRSLVQRAYIIRTSSYLVKEELKHIEVFVMKNNFPIWVVKKIFKEEKEKVHNKKNVDKITTLFKKIPNLKGKIKVNCFCYFIKAPQKGLHLNKSLKRNLKRILPSTVKENIAFTGKKLSTCFQIKDEKSLNTNMIWFN